LLVFIQSPKSKELFKGYSMPTTFSTQAVRYRTGLINLTLFCHSLEALWVKETWKKWEWCFPSLLILMSVLTLTSIEDSNCFVLQETPITFWKRRRGS